MISIQPRADAHRSGSLHENRSIAVRHTWTPPPPPLLLLQPAETYPKTSSVHDTTAFLVVDVVSREGHPKISNGNLQQVPAGTTSNPPLIHRKSRERTSPPGSRSSLTCLWGILHYFKSLQNASLITCIINPSKLWDSHFVTSGSTSSRRVFDSQRNTHWRLHTTFECKCPRSACRRRMPPAATSKVLLRASRWQRCFRNTSHRTLLALLTLSLRILSTSSSSTVKIRCACSRIPPRPSEFGVRTLLEGTCSAEKRATSRAPSSGFCRLYQNWSGLLV